MFARQRVLTLALTHHRREWVYASRGAIEHERPLQECAGIDSRTAPVLTSALRSIVSQLPAAERRLITQLFWNDLTELQIAREAGISQQAISKRKRATLNNLRLALEPPPHGRTPAFTVEVRDARTPIACLHEKSPPRL